MSEDMRFDLLFWLHNRLLSEGSELQRALQIEIGASISRNSDISQERSSPHV
jgi:hypothetical protein